MEKFTENITDEIPFDIHNEPYVTSDQPIIDDPEEQKMLAQHIKNAREKLNKVDNKIDDKEYKNKVEKIKVIFNKSISQLSDILISYDELKIKSNIEGPRKVSKDKLDSEWDSLNTKLKQIHSDIQSIYTDWTIITANQLNK